MGLNRLANLEPATLVQRYEHEKPGDLLHLDIKKLGRFHRPGHRVTGDRRQDSPGAGWEYAHVAIDDHSRVAFSALHPDETGRSACLALLQALRYYAGLGFISVGYSLTMEPVIGRNASRSCVVGWGSSICAPSLTHHKPMARQSASFRPPCVSGPMHGAMTRQSNGQSTCNRGCMSTTGIVLMPVWATSPPSVVFNL